MLRLPRATKQDAAEIRKIQERLEEVISQIDKTSDADEQQRFINEAEDLERRLSIAQSRHLLLGARTQGIELKPGWLVTSSGLEWLTSEARELIENALRRRRTEDLIKLIPMVISVTAIIVSIASAIATSRFSQQKDFLLNRSWLSADDLTRGLPNSTTQVQSPIPKEFSLKLTNHGRAPALRAAAVGYSRSTTLDQAAFRSLTESACTEASRTSFDGDFVAPGSSLAILFVPIESDKSQTPGVIIGCIGYDDSLDHHRHITSFGFRSRAATNSQTDGQVGAWIPYSLGFGLAY
jgi:hypothetical protein